MSDIIHYTIQLPHLRYGSHKDFLQYDVLLGCTALINLYK